jgi:hypothetical protein
VLSPIQLRAEDLELDTPVHETRARLEDRGITVVDLLPALSPAERDGNTCATRDSHWSERGNEVAAEVLAETLDATVRRIAEAKQAPTSGDEQQQRNR